MNFKNTSARFGLVTKLLHWLIALMMLALVWLGWYMVDLTYYDKWYNQALSYHKAAGLVVLGLAAFWLGWRMLSPSPQARESSPIWVRRSATIMHGILVLLMLVIPLTGYVISTSAGKSVSVFDWFNIPALFEISTQLRDAAIAAHYYLAYGLCILVAGHVGAACKHQFVNRDGTLTRMLWR
ncbi:MAG: cytochrome b561 [Gammaproteobacteria bacterium]|jgi:cytochrome b561